MKKISISAILLLVTQLLSADIKTVSLDELCEIWSNSKEGDTKMLVWGSEKFKVTLKNKEWFKSGDSVVVKPCSHQNFDKLFPVLGDRNRLLLNKVQK